MEIRAPLYSERFRRIAEPFKFLKEELSNQEENAENTGEKNLLGWVSKIPILQL